MIRLFIAIALTTSLTFSAMAREPASPIIGRASVIDGDTIEIRGQRIRLFGIDAPEGRQTCTDEKGAAYRCGQKAAQALDYRISDGVVTCEPKDRDRYGRIVAVCRAYGEDLSAWMTGLGWALAFRRYSSNTCQQRNWHSAARQGCGAASSCRHGSLGRRVAGKTQTCERVANDRNAPTPSHRR